METSAKDIYAAGDPIEHNGIVYGIWPAAREQGRIAGLNMSGVQTPYKGTVLSNMLKVTGIDLYSAGDFNAAGAEARVSQNENSYKKILLRDGRPVGLIVLGDQEALKVGQKVMESGVDPGEFIKLL
jgi:nitrite reductase (NADH) large subunit